jgi:hypothetical protein
MVTQLAIGDLKSVYYQSWHNQNAAVLFAVQCHPPPVLTCLSGTGIRLKLPHLMFIMAPDKLPFKKVPLR